ncbi:very short patch repair endonuclease [Micromonospora sp. 15K316]|nr:very short patch repair endonuclease [Micromonospora sp. 15K316]TDC38393.1 very short patch repair endonuclease [Micromonospora sp. 15K316]
MESQTKLERLAPTPPPSSATRAMKANRSKDTKPELALRRALFANGMRYRVGMRLNVPGRSVRPDVVFTRRRVAVFVDGCFWHGCSQHGRMPSDPTGYWHQKMERNRARDAAVDESLKAAGWTVVRVWEHLPASQAAKLVQETVTEVARRQRTRTTGSQPSLN